MKNIENLFPHDWDETIDFKPICTYFPHLDSLLYLEEDVSYRSTWVDGCLFLLQHPSEDYLVGLKVEGIRAFLPLCLEDLSLSSLIKYVFVKLDNIDQKPSYCSAIKFLEGKNVSIDPYITGPMS